VQAVDEVVNNNIPVDTEDDVGRLACQAMAIDLQDDLPEDEDGLVERDLIEYIPKSWREQKEPTVCVRETFAQPCVV
jgi:hypothetical protein